MDASPAVLTFLQRKSRRVLPPEAEGRSSYPGHHVMFKNEIVRSFNMGGEGDSVGIDWMTLPQ